MKQIFTLLSAVFIGSTAMAQIAFQSDFSTWANGAPTDWAGSKTSLAASNYTEVTMGATYGSGMVNLINENSGHKRFTSQSVTVTGGTTYNVNIYVSGLSGDLRTAYYDLTNLAYSSYNNYADLATASAGALTVVTQSITIPANCSNIEIILSLRNTDSLGFVVDSVSLAEPANPPMPVPHTIVELQNNNGNSSAYEDSLTITSGVVTAVKPGDGYWIQDGMGAWTGIYVDDAANMPSRGDSVTVTGKVAELFGVTQIELITNYMLESTPVVAITPTVVSSSDVNNLEDWEGVLVQVVAAECINEDANFGQWTINDGASLADSVLVDDDLFSFAPTLGVDYNITGIGHYSFSASKLLPRDLADITTGPVPSGIEDDKINFSIFPNPAANQFVVKGVNNGTLLIYNISGAVIYSSKINGMNTVNVTNYAAGIYMVKVISNGSTNTQKLIVR